MVYSLDPSILSKIYRPQLGPFFDSMGVENEKGIKIRIKKRGYSVSEKTDIVNESKTHSISFFSGAGGLDIGSQLAGSKVISSLDFDKDSVLTMKSNRFFDHTHHFHKDIKDVSSSDYSQIIKLNNPEKLILIGGPPCQPFSKAGYWVTHKNRLGAKDPRNMIESYIRLIGEILPDGFILENVESLLHPKHTRSVEELKEVIDKLGYKLIIYKANAIDFGVPQKRKRVFFIASKKAIVGTPTKTHGSPEERKINNKLKPYERVVDWIHEFSSENYFEAEESVEGKTYEMELRQIPPGKNYFSLTERDGHPNPKFEANKRFWSFLLKLHPLLPSWTIAAQPGPWVGPFHWSNRRLRVSEISALQTFPADYCFQGSRRSIQKQIGNAVPCLMGEAIVKHLLSNL